MRISEWSSDVCSSDLQQVGCRSAMIAKLEKRCVLTDETGHMKNGAQALRFGDGQRQNGMRMAVNDSDHIRPCAVEFRMDEPFEIDAPLPAIHRLAIEGEFDDVVGAHLTRCHVARQKVAVLLFVVTDADMPERIDHALIEQDMIGRDEISDEGRVGKRFGKVRSPQIRLADGLFDVVRHRSEEHTSELQSLMRISYAVFCLKKKKKSYTHHNNHSK